MKKNRTKRILSMLLTLFMVLTLVPMTAFAANAPANEVTINGDTLNSSYPYLFNGARRSTGGLNGTTCTAHFNASTGTLSLWNYNGSAIAAGDAGDADDADDATDLTVKLKGTNTITGDLRNLINGGNLIITAEEDAFLNITNSENSDGLLAGISTYYSSTTNLGGGSISITGKANITISVTNTNTTSPAKSYGLHAKQGISISDSASLDVTSTCHSPYDYRVYGIYTEHQSFTANTSGVIRVDVSNTQNVKPTAIRASSYSLTMVDQLLCKYNSTGIDSYGTFTKPAGFFAYNKGVVSGTPTTEIRRGSYPFRIATFVDVKNNFGKSTGEYFGGDKVELSAETLEIPFSSWQSSAGSFSSTTSPNTTFTMPYDDVTITARYNAFNYSPYFTKTESGKGTIIFNLHALPDSAPRLVTKTGNETNIVGGTYFYGGNLPREVTITDGTVPKGEYRVAVKIGGLWHFSEVVTVNYDTTYAVTVNNGTGGGNYAAGDTVTIKGNAPEDGEVFYKWTTTDGVEFANENATTTTFVMPAKAVTVTPTYKDIAMLLGTVTITGETRFGETLTAIVTDTNAISPFIYQWKRGFERVPIGTNSETYELVADDITHIIYCHITTERKTNAIGGVTKNPIWKAAAPAAPTGLGSTAETVAGKKDGTITGVQPGQEYALDDGGEWADIEGTTVTNLPAGYYAVRVKETQTHNPGAVAKVTINPGVSATHAVHVTGGTGGGNYAPGETVSITPNEPATGKEFDQWIAVGLSGDGDYEFELYTFSFIMPDNDVVFTATYKDIPVSISSVVISPATTSVQKGTTQNFTATVSGTGAFDSTVTWSVDGIAETTISETGLLTVAEGETATSLIVTATSTVDNTKYASATVTVVRKDILLYGDVNGDSVINVSDAAAIIRYFVKGTALLIPAAADVTDDGVINVSDAAAIIRYFVKGTPLPVNLP